MKRVTYFVSLVSCLSGWSLRSLLTLQIRERERDKVPQVFVFLLVVCNCVCHLTGGPGIPTGPLMPL